jgi:hypothetical protein
MYFRHCQVWCLPNQSPCLFHSTIRRSVCMFICILCVPYLKHNGAWQGR